MSATVASSQTLWDTAKKNMDVLKISTLFIAQDVRDFLSSPAGRFNPTNPDVDQWIRTARDADITNGERTLPPVSGHNPQYSFNWKKYYIPMEVCQTINQNWFWIPGDVAKSVRTLYYWYGETIKHGANFLLDVPPDLSGRIPQNLAERLTELKVVIDDPDKLPPLQTLTGYRPVKASSLLDSRVEYLPGYAVDEDPNTRWLASATDSMPTLTVDLGDIKRFNAVIVSEPYNAHIESFEFQYLNGAEWKTIIKGTGIGQEFSMQFPTVESRMIRLVITKFKTGENKFNVLSFPGVPPPVEGATISELQVFNTSEDYAEWDRNSLLLSNGLIEREIIVENGSIRTNKLKIKGNDLNFNSEESKEFSLLVDSKYYDGQSGWSLISFNAAADIRQGKGATIKLKGTKDLSGIEVDITYLLYPDLPVIRKQITLLNNSGKEVMIESFDIEKLQLGFNYVESVAYTNYGRQKHLSTYVGDWDDPVIAVHSYSRNAGILLGNESPGVLKRTAYNTEYNNVEIGLTHKDEKYPFRKYVKDRELWTTPQVFVIPYINSADPWTTMNTSLADFVRRHMGLRINEITKRPTVMYNNYVPFDDRLNDTLIVTLAKVASECGVKQFEIDCGWHIAQDNISKKVSWIANTGDWIVDKTKFPNGLKPVFDEIRKGGMEPGLWLSVGSAASASKVFKDHPEWSVRGENGEPVNLHTAGDYDLNTMCFGTEWTGYIKKKILDLVHDVGLSFVKLDLTVATSAYITDYKRSGCCAKDHPYHKDREESLIVIYERLFKLFDELHAEAPDLYIDCTFETEGKLQLIDYAFCQHAEGNWLTNIGEPFPVGAFRIRNLTWWKSPALPASSFIIGNLQMDSPDFIQELKTLIGSFPIVLGDLRKLSAEKKAEIRQWTDWISDMQKKYNYDLFRQDLPSFGEPTEGAWDAWSRINTDTREGGIVGIFRQGSLDDQRTISIPGLYEDKLYRVKNAPSGEEITKLTGKELKEKGFKVSMQKKYDSNLFEIELID
jgi:alpha-galactosidase